ncbi:hypothetical protein GGF37_004161 [Kickxella alabastrina]|nr:hypothetical protein GGF37_004161 [Kickxella alabastrina]
MSDHNVTLDSLPYIDKEYDDADTRAHVLLLIQTEMTQMTPPLLPKSTPIFKTNPLLLKEYERIRDGRTAPAFDTQRYKLEVPNNVNNVEEWRLAADNASAQLEHQNMRMVNLELLEQFGANLWKLGNYQREALLAQVERATERYREEAVGLNRERRKAQVDAGETLRGLGERWSEGVRQCIEIQAANAQLRAEIHELEKKQS